MQVCLRTSLFLLLLSVTALLAGSCTGNSNDGTSDDGGFSSSVDSEKQTGQMTESEEETLCQEMLAHGGTTFSEDRRCLLHALGGFGLPETDEEAVQYCRDRYDSCMESGDRSDGTDFCGQAPDGCSVTVGELEACLEVYIEEHREYLGGLPECDEVTVEALEENRNGWEDSPMAILPEVCQAIEDQCDGYFIETHSSPLNSE